MFFMENISGCVSATAISLYAVLFANLCIDEGSSSGDNPVFQEDVSSIVVPYASTPLSEDSHFSSQVIIWRISSIPLN